MPTQLTALHGFTETDETWAEVLAPLATGPLASSLPCQLRCPLMPGHGWRPCPATTTIASVAAEVAAALPADGDLLGYSMGGRIALQLALAHPGRVRRLVLVSCNAGIRDPRERQERQARDAHLADILDQDGIGPFVAWWENTPALRPAHPLPRAVEEELRSRRLNQEPHGLADALHCLGTGAMSDLWPRLSGLRLPVLLIAGQADVHYVTLMREMAGLIPGARLEVVADAGHAVHREQPARLCALVHDFLR